MVCFKMQFIPAFNISSPSVSHADSVLEWIVTLLVCKHFKKKKRNTLKTRTAEPSCGDTWYMCPQMYLAVLIFTYLF